MTKPLRQPPARPKSVTVNTDAPAWWVKHADPTADRSGFVTEAAERADQIVNSVGAKWISKNGGVHE